VVSEKRARSVTARRRWGATAALLACVFAVGLAGESAGSARAAVEAGGGLDVSSQVATSGSVQPLVPHPVAGGVNFTAPGDTIASDRLLVRFRVGMSGPREAAARTTVDATRVSDYQLVPRLEVLKLAPGQDAVAAAAELSRDPSVEYAVPDLIYRVQAAPNDPLYGQQWGLPSIGAPAAWGRGTGSASITVAVLDTGVDLLHPDLVPNLVPGWNFVDDTSDVSDGYGHGTHVAGIIGAAGNNGVGVSGVNWTVGLMPLKICSNQGSCFLSAEISALQYAVAHGAKIVNASFGCACSSYQPEEDAIRAAGNAGLLFVAAAGNNSSNNDATPFYPASYPLDNVLSVAATTASDALASFSDYGPSTVDVAAPGQNIVSTLPTSGTLSSSTGYGPLSGTSMAAPQVAGAAALLWSEHPTWTMRQVRDRLLQTVRPLSSLARKVAGCGELNIDAATDPAVAAQAQICVARLGTGSGTVSSAPAGVSCGATCSTSVAPGSPVTLTASPDSGSTFAHWLDGCTGTASCTFSPTTGATVSAVFATSGSPGGWGQAPLAPPAGVDPLPVNDTHGFFNVSVSADGTERAKTVFHLPAPVNGVVACSYDTTDTGGVYLERKTSAGWVSDGAITAPRVGTDSAARWANCAGFGSVTELSRDGSTLLLTQAAAVSFTGYRCAAFVYRRSSGGWTLDGTLLPPGVDATGSPSSSVCGSFGIGGAISDDGTRVAVLSTGRTDVFVRGGSGWSLEQHIDLPGGTGCGGAGPRMIALAGDGSTLLAGDPNCDSAGLLGVGVVYAYTRSGSQWALAQTLGSPEVQRFAGFGKSIAIADDGSTATFSVTGAVWVYEHDGGGWHASVRLTAPSSAESTLSCPNIVANGRRLICGAFDTVGYDTYQGSLYVFDEPASGWASGGPTAVRAFATEGFSGDELGRTGPLGWAAFGVSADGSLIDAPIAPTNINVGLYGHDRIGYEFTLPAATLLAPPAITSVTPASGPVGTAVTITGTNLSGATVVSFNATSASSFSTDSNTQITATVPAAATTGPVSVRTLRGTAASVSAFTVVPSTPPPPSSSA